MTKRFSTDIIGTIGRATLGAAVLVAAGVCATAMDEARAEPAAAAAGAPQSVPFGEATRSWLALQRSNAEAAPALPVLGAQAALAYERYLDSFKTKIPGSFGSTLGTGSGALGAGYANGGGATPAGAN
jgi:hypothetical protein